MGEVIGGKGPDVSKASDPVLQRAREKVEALGNLNPLWGEVLCAPTHEEAAARIRTLHIASSPEQLLTYVFGALYRANAHVQESAKETLQPVIQGWELPDAFVDQYIQWGEAASATFELNYPDQFTLERSRRIREGTAEFAFKAVRDYLGSE